MRRLPLYPASIGDLWLSGKEGVMHVITNQAHTRACYVFGLRMFQMANPAVLNVCTLHEYSSHNKPRDKGSGSL